MSTEFELINNLRTKYVLDKIGDDCAVLPKDAETNLLITADMLVQDIDFRMEWTTPEMLGNKALAVSLSDIAAMGGMPTSAMLSLGVPEKLWKTDFVERFYAGWFVLAEKCGVELVGGDISRVPDKLVFDSVVLGQVDEGKAILRSGAAVGDAIFVSGYLGAAAAGLKLLESGHRLESASETATRHLLFRQLQPIPQVETGKLLQEYALPSAMLDISDGLSSDLSHLLEASGVGARIDAERIPVDPAISVVPAFAGDKIDFALSGGEDFELLFTVHRPNIPAALDLGFHHIGDITAHAGIIEIMRDGEIAILEAKGYRHF